MVKQTDEKILQESRELLDKLKEMRGGSVIAQHKAFANDPKLLKDFMDQMAISKKGSNAIPAKYKELMVMGMGAILGVETTVKVHGNGAARRGATLEEFGEVFRMVFMLAGVRGLFMCTHVLEPIDYE